jgi:hypothetical protein
MRVGWRFAQCGGLQTEKTEKTERTERMERMERMKNYGMFRTRLACDWLAHHSRHRYG